MNVCPPTPPPPRPRVGLIAALNGSSHQDSWKQSENFEGFYDNSLGLGYVYYRVFTTRYSLCFILNTFKIVKLSGGLTFVVYCKRVRVFWTQAHQLLKIK